MARDSGSPWWDRGGLLLLLLFNALSTIFSGNFSVGRDRETSRYSLASQWEGSGTNQKVFCGFLQVLVVLLICSINFLERSSPLGPHDTSRVYIVVSLDAFDSQDGTETS